MKVVCDHCKYTWDYRGESEYYATCPTCRYKVRIPDEKLKASKKESLRIEPSIEKKPLRLRGVASMVNRVVEKYQHAESMLIQILLELQRSFGWLPKDMLIEVSKQLRIPLSQVYQVVTFYKAFSPIPRGKHFIRLCMGTACKVRGSPLILDKMESELGVERGETTLDGKFSLDTVNCLGCCALGPVATIDSAYYGNLKPADVARTLSKHM